MAPLAVKDPQGRPKLVGPQWPVMIEDGHGGPVNDAVFMVSYANREEKGSDVNVAAHLLLDVLGGAIDGALVISNGRDLRFPVQQTRLHVPVGIVNPSPNYLAGDLRGIASSGVGRHWLGPRGPPPRTCGCTNSRTRGPVPPPSRLVIPSLLGKPWKPTRYSGCIYHPAPLWAGFSIRAHTTWAGFDGTSRRYRGWRYLSAGIVTSMSNAVHPGHRGTGRRRCLVCSRSPAARCRRQR